MATETPSTDHPPKLPPENVALRAPPRPVTRLNRRMLAVLAGGLAEPLPPAPVQPPSPPPHPPQPVAAAPAPAAPAPAMAGEAAASLPFLSRPVPDGLEALFAGRSAGILPLASVLKEALLAPTWPLPLVPLGERLDRRNIAFEPDPRCGALPPAPEASLAFFPAPEGGLHRPAVLAAGRHLVEAVALMAGSGTVSDADFTFLDAALQALDGPTPQERTRLWAYVAALYAPPAPGRAVAEALGRLPAGERQVRIRAIRRVFPLEDARTRVCALRVAMVLDGLSADDLP